MPGGGQFMCDWDAVIEDLRFMRSTGEIPDNAHKRLVAAGSFKGSYGTLQKNIRHRDNVDDLVEWLNRNITDNIITKEESRRLRKYKVKNEPKDIGSIANLLGRRAYQDLEMV